VAFIDYLVEATLINDAEKKRIEVALNAGERLLDAIRRSTVLEADKVATAASAFYQLPLVTDGEWPTAPEALAGLSRNYLRAHLLAPLAEHADHLVVAVADPGNAAAIDALRTAARRPLDLRVASSDDIERFLNRATLETPADTSVAPAEPGPLDGDVDVAHLRDLALDAPIIRLVNELVVQALTSRATDIHIEPSRTRLVVRCRIDGVLHETRVLPRDMTRAVATRVKLLASLDIAERRKPQDGRARINLDGRAIDVRVATVPTINGEAIAMRLLDATRRNLDLGPLGFQPQHQDILRRHLAAPYGLVLVTGPTGSGKTTTLASALSILNQSVRKILTVEDPIEYQIDGINQVTVRPDIGVGFAETLRSFLRHDPDVIMVGELRDSETARIAVQASLTGHLVLSTLHTNSAPGAVTRLLDMGIDGYLLASCLRLVIGQRLVRLLCPACRSRVTKPLDLPEPALKEAGISARQSVEHFEPAGCSRCAGTGYNGRVSVIEMVAVDDPLRAQMKPGVGVTELVGTARASGYRPLVADGIAKILAGQTSPSEVRRVIVEA
jgi:general secretion pathway protein E